MTQIERKFPRRPEGDVHDTHQSCVGLCVQCVSELRHHVRIANIFAIWRPRDELQVRYEQITTLDFLKNRLLDRRSSWHSFRIGVNLYLGSGGRIFVDASRCLLERNFN